MGCRGMRGPIGQGNQNETWWQQIKRKVWNRFWPRSEKILDLFSRFSSSDLTDPNIYDKDGKSIGVKGNRGPD